MKICSTCGAEKPVDDFRKGRNQCKACIREYHREYCEENRERCRESGRKYYEENREKRRKYREENPEKHREKRRKYYEENPEKHRERNRKYREENPEKLRERNRKYREENPEKRSAQKMLQGAILCGLITREPCEVCGAEPAHGHHDDYSDPLEVRWLCPKHHRRHPAEESRRERMTTTPQDQAKTEASNALTIANEHLTALEDFELQSPDDNNLAADMLQDVKQRHKELEAKRKTITKPLLAAKKAVDDLFREPRDVLETAEKILKRKIAGYLEDVAVQNAEAYAAAGAAGTCEEASAALATVATTEAPAGVTLRYTYRATVFNEGLVPDQFRVVDVAAIQAFTNAAVKKTGAPAPIPGVLFEKVPIVTSRKAG